MIFTKHGSFVALAFLLPLYAQGQSTTEPPKPDFSGRWKMVKDKSDFAKARMPDMIIRVIDQHYPALNIHTIQTSGTKTSMADVSYFLDGSTSTNVINGHDATSKTFWDGTSLMVRTNMKTANGEDEEIEDRWELSGDGQTLTTTSHIRTTKGAVDMKLVCEKEKTGS